MRGSVRGVPSDRHSYRVCVENMKEVMTNRLSLSWSDVADHQDQKVEFGACHQYYAWRPHKNINHKFSSLLNAFNSDTNSIRLLLQHPQGNKNARNYQERGRAIYAAVWYPDSNWAILCNSRYATLVRADEIKEIQENKSQDTAIEEKLRNLF